jgi:hypothetical protein
MVEDIAAAIIELIEANLGKSSILRNLQILSTVCRVTRLFYV